MSSRTISLITISRDYQFYIHHMKCTSMSVKHVFSVEVIIHGCHKYQNAWDAPIGGILERWVIFMIPLLQPLKRCQRITSLVLSIFQQPSFQFQTSELVINLHMNPYYECHWTEVLNSVVTYARVGRGNPR